MDKEYERMMKQIDREIDVKETKGAIYSSSFVFLFILVMILHWFLFGY